VQNEDGGLANAYNLGWRASQYEYIVVMHSDCYVERDDALQTIIDYLCMDGVVAAEPWTIVPLQTWDEMSFWDKVANARFVGVEAPGLGGKFDGLRRSALEEIDGYDAKRFFSAGEDVDIAVRLRKIGKVVDTGVRVIHRHLYPDRSSVKFLLLKQVQYGQGFGAIIRKYGRYSGSLFTGSVHVAKILLLAALFVPPLSLYALALLGVLAAAYSWRAFQVWDWRILAIIPVNIFQWIVFFASTVIGFVTGRQAIYYK
jgi:GT2 family glycosyltransferase